jgi:phage terminase large subunit GpA-like protein
MPEYPDEYFKQLTAEHIITKTIKGYRRTEWEKTRDRNEVLDLATYNRIAAAAYGMDRLNDDEWKILEDNLSNTVPQSENNEPARRRRSDYWG